MNRVSGFEGGIDLGSMVISQVEMCDSLALNAREHGRSRRTMSSPECKPYSRPAFLVEVRYSWMDTETSYELSCLDGRDLITLMAESRFEVDAGW